MKKRNKKNKNINKQSQNSNNQKWLGLSIWNEPNKIRPAKKHPKFQIKKHYEIKKKTNQTFITNAKFQRKKKKDIQIETKTRAPMPFLSNANIFNFSHIPSSQLFNILIVYIRVKTKTQKNILFYYYFFFCNGSVGRQWLRSYSFQKW